MYKKNSWSQYDQTAMDRLMKFAEDYKHFLDVGKTERECVIEAERLCKAAGFMNLDELIADGKSVKAGDRVYRTWMGKDFMAFVVGEKPLA